MSADEREPAAENPTDGMAAVTREAASRRRELRAEQAAKAEVEAERDALRERLDESDRREVQRLAGERLADPADLWLAASLDDMRGADGGIDMERADAAITAVLKRRPHWAPIGKRMPDLHAGAREEIARKPSFGEALKRS